MSNKMSCDFTGFKDLLERLDEISGDIKPAVNECLEKVHGMITEEAAEAIKKYHLTGDTEKSLIDKPSVEWSGMQAEMNVGFKIRDGGLASIFLMYGTPKMKKDQQLYNAFRGSKMKKRIKEVQEVVIRRHLQISAKKGK